MSNPMDWREIVRADLAGLPEPTGQLKAGMVRVSTDTQHAVYQRLVAAAEARKMSISSYVRRATMAMVAHDAGIPVSELIQADPRVSRDTGYVVSDPEGAAFGSWQITGLEERDV